MEPPKILGARPVEPDDFEWLSTGLSGVAFFSKLGREQLAEVLPYMLHIRYAAGSVICAEGEPGDALYLIHSGSVSVTKSGRAQPLARLEEGDFFGEMALLFGEPRSATCTALENTEVFCLSAIDFARVVERTPEMTRALAELARARRNRGTE